MDKHSPPPANDLADPVNWPEFRWLVERNADGILVVDGDGLVRFANPAAEQIFGRSRSALIGAPIGIPITAGDAAEITILRPGQPSIEAEIRVVETSWEGAPALLASVRDVTERHAYEQQLRQTQKLEAIGQLTAGVAHDFNNILTSIMGNLEIASRLTEDARMARLLGSAVRSSERAAQLIVHLLAFARKQDLAVQPVDLNPLVGIVEEIFGRTLPAEIELKRRLASDLWRAAADPTQVEVALLNLMINARDAMPNGGRLEIMTRNVPADAPDRPSGLATGNFVALSVVDTGTGMSDAVKARAFEPFFTTKEIGKGSGLGLSTIYGLMRQLGGMVTIDTALGRGTAITLYMPRDEQVENAAQTPLLQPISSSSVRRILVVDDDAAVREVVRAALESQGYAIVEAEHGHMAAELLKRGEAVSMMVTDLAMPGMRGTELANEARRLRPDMPVLFMTGFEPPGDMDGGEALLRKPFRTSDLVTRIADCLGQPRPSEQMVRQLRSQHVGLAMGQC